MDFVHQIVFMHRRAYLVCPIQCHHQIQIERKYQTDYESVDYHLSIPLHQIDHKFFVFRRQIRPHKLRYINRERTASHRVETQKSVVISTF